MWQDMAAAIKGEELHVFTGSTMVNQYMGDFFARAFPFLFKDGAVAMPDMPGQGAGKRRERKVDLEEWTEIFSLRPEHQFGADWAFSYVRWNYMMFRQLLYLGRAMTIPRLRQVEGGEEVTAVHVKEAAEEISRALSLQYRGLDGLLRPVAGDEQSCICPRPIQAESAAVAASAAFDWASSRDNGGADTHAVQGKVNASCLWDRTDLRHRQSRRET